MTTKVSTGLRNGVLATGSLRSLLNGGTIKIYAGSPPATADAAVGAAVLLCTISLNSTATGITLDATAAGGVIPKTPAEIWSGVNAANGVAAWFRHVGPGDNGAESVTQPRIQGTVALSGAAVNLTSLNLTAGAPQPIDHYAVSWPTL